MHEVVPIRGRKKSGTVRLAFASPASNKVDAPYSTLRGEASWAALANSGNAKAATTTTQDRRRSDPPRKIRSGKPWTRQALTYRFRSLGKRLKIEGLKAYHLRHAYISDALARGAPVAIVAQLCGTSIQTIAKHYDKLNQMHNVLRDAARKAIGA
jgi:integrase